MRYRVIAISGALEEQSKVTNIAKKCMLFKNHLDIQLVDIRQVPLINIDLFQTVLPQSVVTIRDKVQNCDGLLFVVPEFFGKVSPAFKNIYDWLSYSPDVQHPSPIRGISACMISVGGQDGTAVQNHMAQMGQFCRLRLMSKPTLHYNSARLQNFGKNFQNSAGQEVEQLGKYLQYFTEFLDRKFKSK